MPIVHLRLSVLLGRAMFVLCGFAVREALFHASTKGWFLASCVRRTVPAMFVGEMLVESALLMC